MERIETSKLNRSLKDILAQVAEGKRFILTRYGKDVAALGPPNMTILDGGTREADPIRIEPFLYEDEPQPKSGQNARDELLNRIRTRK